MRGRAGRDGAGRDIPGERDREAGNQIPTSRGVLEGLVSPMSPHGLGVPRHAGPAPALHVQPHHGRLRTSEPGRRMSRVIPDDNLARVRRPQPPPALPFMINDRTPNLHLAMQISLAGTDAAVHMETGY